MLLLKLTLAPLLVAAATLVTRTWGPRVGGLLMGLPLTTGPIFLFLAIDHGPRFAARATVGILCGLIGLAAFAVGYVAASGRAGWRRSYPFAAVLFLVVSIVASRLGDDVIVAGPAAWLALVLATVLIPRPRRDIVGVAPPWWDLWVRMAVVAALTLALTAVAGTLGPTLSGIVGTYPIALTVIVTFTHAQLGRDAIVAMLRGSTLAWTGFASCFLVIGVSIEALGISASMGLGGLAAVVTSALVLWIDRGLARTALRRAVREL